MRSLLCNWLASCVAAKQKKYVYIKLCIHISVLGINLIGCRGLQWWGALNSRNSPWTLDNVCKSDLWPVDCIWVIVRARLLPHTTHPSLTVVWYCAQHPPPGIGSAGKGACWRCFFSRCHLGPRKLIDKEWYATIYKRKTSHFDMEKWDWETWSSCEGWPMDRKNQSSVKEVSVRQYYMENYDNT